MRRLNERNKSYVYYAPCTGKTITMTDDTQDALYTGENPPTYGNVVEARMVVGIATGNALLEDFGINNSYAVKLVTDDVDCPIDEESVMWIAIGKVPEYSANETYVDKALAIKSGKIQRYDSVHDTWSEVPYTHVVTRVAKSFGYITYLLQEVDVSL